MSSGNAGRPSYHDDQMRVARELQADRTRTRAQRQQLRSRRRGVRGGARGLESSLEYPAINPDSRGLGGCVVLPSSRIHATTPAVCERGSFISPSSTNLANSLTMNATTRRGGLGTSIWADPTNSSTSQTYLRTLETTQNNPPNLMEAKDATDLDKSNTIGTTTSPRTVPTSAAPNPVVENTVTNLSAVGSPLSERSILDDDAPLPAGLQVALMPTNAQKETHFLERNSDLSTPKRACD